MHAHTHAGMHESTSGLLAQTLTFRPTLRQQRELLRLVLATQDVRGVQTGAVLQSTTFAESKSERCFRAQDVRGVQTGAVLQSTTICWPSAQWFGSKMSKANGSGLAFVWANASISVDIIARVWLNGACSRHMMAGTLSWNFTLIQASCRRHNNMWRRLLPDFARHFA